MTGRAATPQGRNLGNINNMPNKKYLPSINFFVPFATWSHFYVSIDWTIVFWYLKIKSGIQVIKSYFVERGIFLSEIDIH
jgi:hypothetical protein